MTGSHPSEAVLNDHVDGLLSGPEAEEVRAHLARCASCRQIDEELRLLLARAAALPGIEPRRDLLPGIRAAVASRRPWLPWAALAASLLLVAVAVVATLTRPVGDVGVRPAEPSTASAPERAPAAGAAAELLAAEREFVRATRKLLDVLEQRRERLRPETLATVERELAALDQAISETRDAVARNPGREHGGQALATLHHKKLQILWTISRLTS